MRYQKYKGYYEQEKKRLERFHNVHEGERCFIIGLAPSINKTNLSLLKEEFCFGVNGFFKDMDRFGVTPFYYCVADGTVYHLIKEELLKIKPILFLTNGAGEIYLDEIAHRKPNVFIVRDLGGSSSWLEFGKDMSKGIYGGMVVLQCLQIAYYMGFDEVYLVGCDCSFKDGVHYDNSIYAPIINKWDSVFQRYEIYKKEYEKDNRKIINCTVGGELEVFERKELEDVV